MGPLPLPPPPPPLVGAPTESTRPRFCSGCGWGGRKLEGFQEALIFNRKIGPGGKRLVPLITGAGRKWSRKCAITPAHDDDGGWGENGNEFG